MSEVTEISILKEISAKLDRLIAVTAIAGKEESERADILIKLGIEPKVISTITGMTTNALAVRKTRLNKVKKAGK